MQIPCDFVLPLWQVSLFVSCPLRSGLPSKDKSWRWIKTKSRCKHTENILNSQKKRYFYSKPNWELWKIHLPSLVRALRCFISTKDYALTRHTVRLLPKKVRNTVKRTKQAVFYRNRAALSLGLTNYIFRQKPLRRSPTFALPSPDCLLSFLLPPPPHRYRED